MNTAILILFSVTVFSYYSFNYMFCHYFVYRLEDFLGHKYLVTFSVNRFSYILKTNLIIFFLSFVLLLMSETTNTVLYLNLHLKIKLITFFTYTIRVVIISIFYIWYLFLTFGKTILFYCFEILAVRINIYFVCLRFDCI